MKITKYIIAVSFILASMVFAQDIKVAGTLTSNTDRWRPIYSQGSGVNLTNSFGPLTALTFTVPGGTMGSNGILRITYQLTSPSLTLNNKGAVFMFDAVGVRTNNISSVTIMTLSGMFSIVNRNNPSSQITVGTGNVTASQGIFAVPPSTFSINTDIDQTFSVILTNSVSSDSVTLECFSAEVLRRN